MASDNKVLECVPVEMKNREKWYGDAKDYWKEIPSTVEGMLGGFSHISSTDVAGSTKFLEEFLNPAVAKKQRTQYLGPKTQSKIALDCGAGIGRVAKHLLLPLFDTVDMVEQNQEFLEKAQNYLGEKKSRVENLFSVGLQEFDPSPGRYDVIWCQWVMGHLTDEDFVSFLNRCKKGLNKGGLICIKENVCRHNHDVDTVDSSVTRSHMQYMQLFKEAEMKVLKEETQRNFPSELYKVNMYALAPMENTEDLST